MKELIEKRGKKLLFTILWIFFYMSMVNRINPEENASNFIIYFVLIPAVISLLFLGIERIYNRRKRREESL
jgi:hypothetical protein